MSIKTSYWNWALIIQTFVRQALVIIVLIKKPELNNNKKDNRKKKLKDCGNNIKI